MAFLDDGAPAFSPVDSLSAHPLHILWPGVGEVSARLPILNFLFRQKAGLEGLSEGVYLRLVANDRQVAVTITETP